MAEERQESAGFFEMLWDCEFCGTKGLLGKSQRCCPECGGKQNADKRYFPPEGQEAMIQGHKYEGSDRYCPACNNPQGAAGKNCTNCGSAMDGSAEVKGVQAPVAPPPPKKSKLWIIIVVIAVVGAIIGIVLGVKHCNRTKDASAKVIAHAWERTVPIQEYKDVREEAWRNEIPNDASGVTTCHQAERSRRQIEDGEDCHKERKDKKDGTGEMINVCKKKYRSEPVMDDKCSYTVKRWKEIDKKVASGAGMNLTDPPNLDKEASAPGMQGMVGARRLGPKQDTFYLDLDVPGADPQKQRCEVKAEAWKKFADNAAAVVQVLAKNGKVDCDKSF